MSLNIKEMYDKYYKWVLILPALALIFSVFYMIDFHNKTGDFINKDVSLTGGTSVTVFDSKIDIDKLKSDLRSEFPDIVTRKISNIRTGEQTGFSLETKSGVDEVRASLEKYLGYKLTSENASIEFSGSSLSEGFYNQIINSMIAAFLLMSWLIFFIFSDSKKAKGLVTVVSFLGLSIALPEVSFIENISILFIIAGTIYSMIYSKNKKVDYSVAVLVAVVSLLLLVFYHKSFLLLPIWIVLIFLYIKYSIPSFAVILSAFADLFLTIVVVNMMGINVSSAGVIAFLMLIGYSVDTDILLTSRVLRAKEGSIDSQIWSAFKTGMTMTLTAIAAIAVSLLVIYNFSESLRQIFTIILIGLGFDIFNTWITNTSMLKWYMEHKK